MLDPSREQEATETRDNDAAAGSTQDVAKATPTKGGTHSLASYVKKFIAIEHV